MNTIDRARVGAVLAAAAAIAAPLSAQQASPPQPLRARVSVTTQLGQFTPAGGSEAFRLFDRELTRGTSALAPKVMGASLRVRAWKSLHVVASVEGGDEEMQSTSRAQATASVAPSRQQTSFALSGVQTVGVQWQAWQWGAQAPSRTATTVAAERLRLFAGAGAGRASYTLHQWGSFVDATRLVAFEDDLRSKGHGTVGYVNATAEVPLTRWAAVQLDVRHQFGAAPMNGSFAGFDDLDLSGMRYALGVTWSPWR